MDKTKNNKLINIPNGYNIKKFIISVDSDFWLSACVELGLGCGEDDLLKLSNIFNK